jgi:hypothetical protein
MSASGHRDLDTRNRRVLRVLLGVAGLLAAATFLAGIRW